MSKDDWYRPVEVAALLGVKSGSVVKRARRHEDSEADSNSVRRAAASVDGGRPRVEIHSSLVAQWLDDSELDGGEERSSTRAEDLLRGELGRARRGISELQEQLHSTEIRRRDEEIARLTESLMSSEFEVADLRNQLSKLGQVIAALTKSTE